MLAGCETVPGRRLREPKARVVGSDTPEVLAELQDHLPVEERPGGVAVEHEQRLPFALVYVVHIDPVPEVGKAVLEGVEVLGNVELERSGHGPSFRVTTR